MLVQKHRKARLSPYSKLFFQLGLALSLLITYISMEWKSYDKQVDELGSFKVETEELIDIPITERILEIKPPPPPPPVAEQIQVIANEEEIIETVLETTETDQSEIIEIKEIIKIEEIVEEEEVVEDVPFAIIETAPIYPGCKGSKEALKKCFEEKIREHVNRNYRTALAGELSLSPGKKKVYVLFKIDKKGNIVNIKARGPHKRLEKESIRVIQNLPQMTPGKQRGRSVGVKYTLPITLIVETDR